MVSNSQAVVPVSLLRLGVAYVTLPSYSAGKLGRRVNRLQRQALIDLRGLATKRSLSVCLRNGENYNSSDRRMNRDRCRIPRRRSSAEWTPFYKANLLDKRGPRAGLLREKGVARTTCVWLWPQAPCWPATSKCRLVRRWVEVHYAARRSQTRTPTAGPQRRFDSGISNLSETKRRDRIPRNACRPPSRLPSTACRRQSSSNCVSQGSRSCRDSFGSLAPAQLAEIGVRSPSLCAGTFRSRAISRTW